MNNTGVTLVTGLWDIKRDALTEGWSRSYEFYLEKFGQLLEAPNNMIIFGDKNLRDFVFNVRTEENTQFIERSEDWFINEFFEVIQSIRTNKEWYGQVGWLGESTQAKLEMYNPLVLSKPFILHDAKLLDKFKSTHLFWIDAGITNTVHPGYFTHDLVVDKLNKLNKISFLAFPYIASSEIHGFNYKRLNELAGSKVNKVCRGGFFGGPVEEIPSFNGQYYELLGSTLHEGYMGTEESLFTILLYRYPEKYQYFPIEGNGLVSKYFEDLKNDLDLPLNESVSELSTGNIDNTALYIITYNSPKQLETLIASMRMYDEHFITKPKWILLNNSTDKSTFPEYEKLCKTYNIEHIQKDNIGICGGRQWVAEHAAENDFDYYFFFEDDMFFYNGERQTCRNGFARKIDQLYRKSLQIIKNENFDFLKLNFTEFYGDNQLQWSWHNVPQQIREEFFKDKPEKISNDTSDAPYLKFSNIKVTNGLPYATGEVFYCNWPQIVSKEGNKKMFLEVKWDRPYEQTWMSHIYQETVKNNIKPGILLATPTEHNRFDFYPVEERRES
ncbi:WlaTC/HtrL family glycosyltransferase [uncultured Arcticibacterium sp.]|uniref:WlaTC/HtrL family glycosyltransferase n=1 Tax=uncultured Arcticibacterium sp. TaxID=2173042 RepID=UPI0030FBC7CC